MKVGIMSMQRIKNYGSFLQAYALKKTIESMGNDVEFVDYHQVNASSHNRYTIKNIVKYFLHSSTRKKRKMYAVASLYEAEFDAYFKILGLNEEYNYNPELDVLVIGSDEVFNCYQTHDGQVLSLELFGKDSKCKRLISYAASFGHTTLEQIIQNGEYDTICGYLNQFDSISVRDENSAHIITDMLGTEPKRHLDPVFLYDFEDELSQCDVRIPNEPYMIVYAYRGRFSAEEGKYIKRFAQKNNLKIIALEGVQDFCDDFVLANPFEVIRYVQGAEYVVTDTFHGTVFSIKYNKKFASFVRDSNSQKLKCLLNKFNLCNHIVDNLNDFENVITYDEDYDRINEMIDKEVEISTCYLKDEIMH